MKVKVVDISTSGHREVYYKQIANSFSTIGCEVELFAPTGGGGSSSVSYTILEVGKPLSVASKALFSKVISIVLSEYVRIKNLVRIRRKAKLKSSDFVFFACLDDVLPTLLPVFIIDWLMNYRWSGLLVQSVFPRKSVFSPNIKRALKSNQCVSVCVLNEYSVAEMQEYNNKVFVMPDFSYIADNLSIYDLKTDYIQFGSQPYIVCLLGSIHSRKGVDLLLETAKLLPTDKYQFVVAGKSSLSKEEEEKLILQANVQGNIVLSLNKIPDEYTFNSLIYKSDVVFAVYNDFYGSSNLLTKAAQMKKPVVVAKGHCMGCRVELFDTGIAIDAGDVNACVDAITYLCEGEKISDVCFDEYAKKHSIEQLELCLQAVVKEV